ncbi:GNAT family N-acetyltransferase [Levilactobacillus namurensis]|uniref:GNAT family N-acetyltransferase n=1 Tax=Levilactobacillus namurensis TaxID=380393 RepID=A0AAW8W6B6_9LACO|nr:GNAT family N-acetyltransferase [Levilactobacillus namurensis]MDT7013946.1 GNAT family N-acetyltransferase [Levilactobacillus namurensis]
MANQEPVSQRPMVVSLPVEQRTDAHITELTAVWEASVRATHKFLLPSEVQTIKQLVPPALRQVPQLLVARNADQRVLGFMGLSEQRVEMLFVAPDSRGTGVGKTLLTMAIRRNHVTEVTVNQQNPQAVGFYHHMGFQTYRRTMSDEQGAPYPLLYLRLETE